MNMDEIIWKCICIDLYLFWSEYRRMSHLSVDTVLEMIKGDAGELPVGREIVSPGKQP